MEDAVRDEISVPFTGIEMSGVLRNPGGFEARADPYGLAVPLQTTLSPFAREFTPCIAGAAALARLAVGSQPSLGLDTSRPYFVNEAYTNAQQHAREADGAYEHAMVYGYYSDEWNEEMSEENGDDDTLVG
jgi:hypothetical protein